MSPTPPRSHAWTWIALTATATVAGAVSSLITAALVAPEPPPPSRQEDRWSDLASELAQLRADLQAQRPATPTGDTAAARAAVTPTDGAIERAVLAVLERRGLLDKGDAAATDTGDARRAMAEILSRGDDADVSDLWQTARENGTLDQLVAAFEQRAKAQPQSADARVDLGLAYVQQLLAAPNGAEQTRIGKLADQAFSKALELDPSNWRARFRKAEGLSHWPAASGKQAEAVHHFELLVQQQSSLPPEPRFARTYVYLGNLYAQMGQAEKAKEIWQQGLALHPGNQALLAKNAAENQ